MTEYTTLDLVLEFFQYFGYFLIIVAGVISLIISARVKHVF